MALTDKLTAIADAIRGKTGKTDALTLEQMPGEIEGIQSGGGGLPYDMGEFVLDANTQALVTTDGIPHELGEAPDFILVWTDDFADLSADNVNPYGANVNAGYIWLNGLTGLVQRITASVASSYGLFNGITIQKDAYTVSFSTPSSSSYFMAEKYIPSAKKIPLVATGATTQQYKAGITYRYFVSKAWWNVGGVVNAE